jgi:hypothetical protein
MDRSAAVRQVSCGRAGAVGGYRSLERVDPIAQV